MTFSTDYFTRRASVRSFLPDKEVPFELLQDLLRQAAHAPNTGNMQTYSAVVTTSPELLAALAPTHFSQPAATGAKALVTFCRDVNRFNRWCALNGTEPGLNNLQGFLWGVIDTSLFAQQFCTLAELHGLGTCYLGTTSYNAGQTSDILGLPAGVEPIVTVAVGWPAAEPEPTPRLPVEAYVHRDRYADPSDADIRRFYAPQEADPQMVKFVQENGKENLAQVFAEVRYPRDANEHFSRVYKEFLKEKGTSL